MIARKMDSFLRAHFIRDSFGPHGETVRRWREWRQTSPNIDRALAIADAALAPESISDTLHDCAHKDTGNAMERRAWSGWIL